MVKPEGFGLFFSYDSVKLYILMVTLKILHPYGLQFFTYGSVRTLKNLYPCGLQKILHYTSSILPKTISNSNKFPKCRTGQERGTNSGLSG